MTMKEYAPAKINLFLDVIRKREDGYHDLGTVFQTVDAGDTVEAELREDGEIHLTYNEPQNYPLESDLVFKAAKALKEYANCALGADIHLTKVMPLGAGLGGGSADAAATLRLLNRLWNLSQKIMIIFLKVSVLTCRFLFVAERHLPKALASAWRSRSRLNSLTMKRSSLQLRLILFRRKMLTRASRNQGPTAGSGTRPRGILRYRFACVGNLPQKRRTMKICLN